MRQPANKKRRKKNNVYGLIRCGTYRREHIMYTCSLSASSSSSSFRNNPIVHSIFHHHHPARKTATRTPRCLADGVGEACVEHVSLPVVRKTLNTPAPFPSAPYWDYKCILRDVGPSCLCATERRLLVCIDLRMHLCVMSRKMLCLVSGVQESSIA